jgi:hypothetical protein
MLFLVHNEYNAMHPSRMFYTKCSDAHHISNTPSKDISAEANKCQYWLANIDDVMGIWENDTVFRGSGHKHAVYNYTKKDFAVRIKAYMMACVRQIIHRTEM